MKRFYKSVDTKKTEQGWQVTLDGKALPTPLKLPLILPTEKLAKEIAREWDAQGETIDKRSMPMMAFASVAIDIVPKNRDELTAEMLSYSETDLVCYRSEDEKIAPRQAALFDPLIAKLKNTYGFDLKVTNSVMPVVQPQGNGDILLRHIKLLKEFHFAGLMVAMQTMGSIFLALLLKDGHIDEELALKACRFDEMAQAERWGITDTHVEKQQQVQRELKALVAYFTLLKD